MSLENEVVLLIKFVLLITVTLGPWAIGFMVIFRLAYRGMLPMYRKFTKRSGVQ